MKKCGLLLILFAIFLPLVTLPLAQGMPQRGGFVSALQALTIPIVPEKRSANFADGPITGNRSGIVEVQLEESGVAIEFPDQMNGSEITRALNSVYYVNGKLKLKNSTPTKRHFVSWWVSQEGFSVRYAFLVSISLALLLIGIVMCVFQGHSQVTHARSQ